MQTRDFCAALERAPHGLTQPLALDVTGRAPGALMTFSRGFRLQACVDVLASPELAALLERTRLPRRDDRLRRDANEQASRPYRWIWWEETFGDRIDVTRSTFFLRYLDGAREEVAYDSLEDLVQVQRRAANTLEFAIAPATLEWTDASIDELDLIPLGGDLLVSPTLGQRLEDAKLPGICVLPPREK